jgi:hypothetical protein
MPLPFLAAGAGKIISEHIGDIPLLGGLAKRLRKPSERRAADVAGPVLASALDGNLTAVRAIARRTQFGIQKERDVWTRLINQIPLRLVQQAMADEDVPEVDHSTPESAAREALQFAYYGPGGAKGIRSRRGEDIYQQARQPERGLDLSVLQRGGTQGTQSGGGTSTRQGASGGRSGAARRGRSSSRESSDARGLSSDERSNLTKTERRRMGLTTRKVTRYDPDTGRARKVWADSDEAASWPSRKPSKRQRQLEQKAERALSSGALKGARAAGSAVSGIGAAAGLGVGATAAAIAGAFAVGYAIGTAALAIIDHYSTDKVNERKALAFRHARDQWAVEHGRPMTPAEVREMGRGYRAAIPKSLGGTK